MLYIQVIVSLQTSPLTNKIINLRTEQNHHGSLTLFQEAPTLPRNPFPGKKMGLRNPRTAQGLPHMARHLPHAGDGRRRLRRRSIGLERRRRRSQPPSLRFQVSNPCNQLCGGYTYCCLRCSRNGEG